MNNNNNNGNNNNNNNGNGGNNGCSYKGFQAIGLGDDGNGWKEAVKRQLELQDKGFIRPSHSLWGAPVLFVTKKRKAIFVCGFALHMSKIETSIRDTISSEYMKVIFLKPHLEQANMVADALSKKERVKPKRVRTIAMTIQSGVKGMILAAQGEAFDQENIMDERLHGLDPQMERKGDWILYFMDRI
ncbi:hypothetical protein Tco_0655552 [Tanacetum coccineum]|uniref:Reverse transcriptase domain-containing protein n=1 Tax=Tanacetum coccineum TaxID=301880 RepID=A0ABQ4X6T1_9ASTR